MAKEFDVGYPDRGLVEEDGIGVGVYAAEGGEEEVAEVV
jgi:hypothetical protein